MGEDQTNIRGPIIMYKYQEWKQQWQKWKERLQLGGPDGEQDKKIVIVIIFIICIFKYLK